MKVNQNAFDAGQLAERLSQTYYSYLSVITVAADNRARLLVPEVKEGFIVPIGTVERKDGTAHAFNFDLFLSRVQDDASYLDEFKRTWLGGAVLVLGDKLAENQYFDRAPELELIRHLRNAVAHGNSFRIDRPGSLITYPAHNRLAWVRSDMKSEFAIDISLQGKTFLFDFMGAGDVLDLLMSVGLYLIRMGNGDPLRP
jgi:hypothetical protein